jgi:hypothetical protein
MHNVYTQTLQIHYTYFTDSTSIEQETRQRVAGLLVKLGEVLDHPDISTSLPIDVVFLHPDYLGSLQFKENVKHNAQQNFVQWWNSQYDNSLRLLFFFEKVGTQYQFKVFEATPAVRDMQLPDLVYNYINEQIIAPHTNEPKEAVYWGLNAVKNAFDRRFMENLVTIAPTMLEFKYYYKGYAYSGHHYYYAEYEDYSRHGQNIAKELFFLHEGVYYPVYLDEVLDRRAVVFDKFFEHPIYASLGNGNIILISETNLNSLYVQSQAGYTPFSEFNITFNRQDMLHFAGASFHSFSELPAGELKNYVTSLINSRKVKEVKPNSSDFMNDVETEELLYVNKRYAIHTGTTRQTVRSQLGTPQEATPITPKIGWSISLRWREVFHFAQPTWCNMFASDLSNLIYGKVGSDYPVPYGNSGKLASEIYDHFVAGVDYIEFSRNLDYGQGGISNFIWTNYVNKGLPVYFSSRGNPGHIETAFPSGYINNGTNRKYFDDENCGSTLVNAGSNYLVVGAGGRVGFKSYERYAWLRNDATKIFLYLGYLKKE